MRTWMMAAVAAMSLAACGQLGLGGASGSGPALPAPQQGVTAPSVLTPPTTPVEQVNISSANREEVMANLNDLLNQAGQHFAPGFAPPQGFADETTSLQPATDHRWRFNLSANTEYRILGVCDVDCSNVDIELVDSRGGVVASDVLPDDYPVVSFTPPADGTYYARLMMQSCTRAPCYAAMRVVTAGAAAPTGK